MGFDLVGFQIHLRFENNELLFQTFLVKTDEVILREMLLKSVVINVILLLAVGRASVTDVAAFMFIAAVGVQLIITVESLATETALRVTPEATLIYSARFVVTRLFVFS